MQSRFVPIIFQTCRSYKNLVGGQCKISKILVALFKEFIAKKIDDSIIPTLQRADKTSFFSGVDKSNLIAEEFATKRKLPGRLVNEYNNKLDYGEVDVAQSCLPIRERHVAHVVNALGDDSSTRPDLSARILNNCANNWTKPITMLAREMWNQVCGRIYGQIAG